MKENELSSSVSVPAIQMSPLSLRTKLLSDPAAIATALHGTFSFTVTDVSVVSGSASCPIWFPPQPQTSPCAVSISEWHAPAATSFTPPTLWRNAGDGINIPCPVAGLQS